MINQQLIERLKSGEFPSRVVLAKVLGCSPSVVTKLGREVISQGLMDAPMWARCFQTPAIHGQRKKDKRKRKKGSGTWARSTQVAEGQTTTTTSGSIEVRQST